MHNNTFGKTLRYLRNEKGITEEELGQILGYSNQTISFWEIGRREPDLDTIVKIAKFFDVTSDFLLGLKEF